MTGAKVPKVPKTKACKATPGEPEGYVARGAWMEERFKRGLIQRQCSKCKFWHIWVIKPVKASRPLQKRRS